jgi:hypothetical protein
MKKRFSKHLPTWKKQQPSTDNVKALLRKPEAVQSVPIIDAQTVADAIDAATQMIAMTTTATTKSLSSTVNEDIHQVYHMPQPLHKQPSPVSLVNRGNTIYIQPKLVTSSCHTYVNEKLLPSFLIAIRRIRPWIQ